VRGSIRRGHLDDEDPVREAMNDEGRTGRRSLIAAGAAALVAPAWLAHAFAAPQSEVPGASARDTGAFEAAVGTARARGKPLMVVLVPPQSLRHERGRLWGDLFAYASDAVLADFVLCEWACFEVAELRRRFPALAFTDEVVAALIETTEASATSRAVSFPVGDLAPATFGKYPSALLRTRAEKLAEALQAAILPDAQALERRAQQNREAARPGTVAMPDPIGAWLGRPRLRDCDAWAAALRQTCVNDERRAPVLTQVLAQACALRLWEEDFAGSHWSAEHVDLCPPCGMGSIGSTGRAFLEFYARPAGR
jgi:hypothetical protein